jgi:tetratricopeptide (TPR) repeat protein
MKPTLTVTAALLLSACGAVGCSKSGETSQVKPRSDAAQAKPVTTAESFGSRQIGEEGFTPDATPQIAGPVSFADGEAAYHARKYSDATAIFEQYIVQRPGNPWGHYMLGLSAWKAGDLDRARLALERSHDLDPTHVKSLLNLGRVLLDLDRAGEAKERIEAALALDSTSGEVHRMLGRVQSALGSHEAAIEAYRVALTFDPTEAWAMNNLALIYIQQERYEEALGPLARAVQLRPGAPVFQNNLGIVLERTGHIGAAREAFVAAIAADSSYVKAQVSLKRVEGREDDPAVIPVELSVLADAFEREVQRWREERMAAVTPETGVTVTPESLATIPDSLPLPPR